MEPSSSTLVSLGEALFFDSRLSADGTVSCATCHRPDTAFADGKAVSVGIRGQAGTRNAPSLFNVRDQVTFFWDGRAATLEQQVIEPFTNQREHGFPGLAALVDQVRLDQALATRFKEQFGGTPIDGGQIAIAVAAFVRSLEPKPSTFDRYWTSKDRTVLPDAARRGLDLFTGRAQCSTCHVLAAERPRFTDDRFHSLGIGHERLAESLSRSTRVAMASIPSEIGALLSADAQVAALGRFNVTRKPADIGKYRTPSLRNVAVTAPYMHDGSVSTLEEAVDLEIYYRSGQIGRPIILTPQERRDLVAFLHSLTSDSFKNSTATQ
jgi:cytochrome c peroxidase